ncbi:hydroxycarboxylic acid receptor 1-like [Physella acuta]|uniref:hydroxycarboxylic acid receptor 1-like n=1 Tax=Physella acuta TaxID=109671 RepID=UPI0027DD3299|nr:hydroxycarboxylic acid receptor 1-like [Physella acuta]
MSEFNALTISTDTPSIGGHQTQVISDDLASVFFFVNYVSLGQAINIFGILTNMLSIYVFIKMGFRDTVNISLICLTVSDLFSLLTLFLFNLCQTPEFYNLNLPFEPYDVAFLTVGWGHVGFSRITCSLTAFISIERCFCIALPLKVKSILTPFRTWIIVLALFPISYLSVLPIYLTASLTIQFSAYRNRSLLVMTYNIQRGYMESISSIVNNIIPVSSFIIIVVTTLIIVFELQRKATWRKTSTANKTLVSDKKVEKIVMFISIIFIVCYLPSEILFLWMLIDPEIRFDGKDSNLFKVSVSILYLAETVNASVNIFVYYFMSSKYKQVLKKMFFK